MRKKILLIPLALLLAISLVAIGCAAPAPEPVPGPPGPPGPPGAPAPAPAPAPVVEEPALTYHWKIGTCVGGEHLGLKAAYKWSALLAERSNDRIIMDIYPEALLGDYVFQNEQITLGYQEGCWTCPASEYEPRWDICYLGFGPGTWPQIKEMWGPKTGWMPPILEPIFEDSNYKCLGIFPSGFVNYASCERRVTTPEEAKGFKMRVMLAKNQVLRFNAMGFSTVPMAFSELYTALQTGVVDGRAACVIVEAWDMRDALKYFVFSRDSFEVWPIIINLDLWNSVAPEDQAIFQEVTDEVINWTWEQAVADEQHWVEMLEDYGMGVIYLTDEEWETFANRARSAEWPYFRELVGDEIMDSIMDELVRTGVCTEEATLLSR